MTRIISKLAEDKLTLGHPDIDLKYYDLGIGCRHQTDDRPDACDRAFHRLDRRQRGH